MFEVPGQNENRMHLTFKEEANFQTGRPFLFTKFKMNAQQVPQCNQRRVTYLLSYTPSWQLIISSILISLLV